MTDLLRPSDFLAFPPCLELDAAVEALLCCLGRPSPDPPPPWSTDASAVCALIDELARKGLRSGPWYVELTRRPDEEPPWSCYIAVDDWWSEGDGETMPLAFCRALLLEQDD